MAAKKELEKLQLKRAKLEAESRYLKQEKKTLEFNLKFLEEQVAIEELIENNKIAKDSISHLEAKLKELKDRIKEKSQTHPSSPAPPPLEQTNAEVVAPPSEEIENAQDSAEVRPSDNEENGVTVTAIDKESVFETKEVTSDKQQARKKHRFF